MRPALRRNILSGQGRLFTYQHGAPDKISQATENIKIAVRSDCHAHPGPTHPFLMANLQRRQVSPTTTLSAITDHTAEASPINDKKRQPPDMLWKRPWRKQNPWEVPRGRCKPPSTSCLRISWPNVAPQGLAAKLELSDRSKCCRPPADDNSQLLASIRTSSLFRPLLHEQQHPTSTVAQESRHASVRFLLVQH